MPRFPEELVASSTFLLKRLGFPAKDSLEAYEHGRAHPYHYAMLIVARRGSRETTQGSIADALGYDRGQLVGLLDELEEKGLVERRRDPNDRRRHLVPLTPEGRRRSRRCARCSAELEDDFLSPLEERARGSVPRAAAPPRGAPPSSLQLR